MKAVLATLSEFQLKTLEAENSIDNENDCHADAEYSKPSVTNALKNKETARILRGPTRSRSVIVMKLPESKFEGKGKRRMKLPIYGLD